MTRTLIVSSLICLIALAGWGTGSTWADDLFFTDEQGLRRAVPPEVPEAWRNQPWPEEVERRFWTRVNHAMRHHQGQRSVNTHGENEKADYPRLMFAYMAGFRNEAIRALQTEDVQAGSDHAWTLGIDYYWCFTLKGQMRKYFYFGDKLDPQYRDRMKRAAAIWTAEDPRPTLELVLSLNAPERQVREYALELLQKIRANIAGIDDIDDPMEGQDLGDDVEKWMEWWKYYADKGWQVFEDVERRANPFPHPRHGVGTGPVGAQWDPQIRGMRVDARNTDNLRAMREGSVYLMAEEAGNEKVRLLYKDKIRRFVADMYHVGMGEWDSENYLHHTIAPYHNLYDFAQDEEVVAMAKAALDWMYTAAAIKYYRGTAGAPTKRTGGGLDRFLWMIFGDSPVDEPRPEYDLAHAATSAYRPPMAVMALAKKQLDLPFEQINTKPTYSLWLPGAAETPETWETIFQGRSYYLGSAVARGGAGDVRAFEMLTYSGDRAADRIQINSGNRLSGKRGGDQIGQYRNQVIWLNRGGDQFSFSMPRPRNAVIEDGVWFIELERTFLAIRPLNLQTNAANALTGGRGGNVTFRAAHTGGAFSGFTLEVGEKPDFRDLEHFRQSFRRSSRADLSALAQGTVELTGIDGRKLRLTHNRQNDLPIVYRDGERYDWLENMDLYRPMTENAPVSLGWREGTLRVRAGGHEFEQTVDRQGRVTFTDRPAAGR
ncbi:MAG: hypothetical protein JJU36_11795 [Phycisphaeraceae bacterium]|nr:hypothetical protein [Phycisphaeraceae bacterium]